NTETVCVGVTVKVLDIDFEEELTYKVVGSAEADPLAGLISDDSPVGKALIGARVGDEVVAEAPVGELRFKILSISR
ncbi:MAG: GreA/GreB family elongation factor, partial [Clostridia bacterium]|nr:GreA/GreB family elongation factor [Clostridia bacterium]